MNSVTDTQYFVPDDTPSECFRWDPSLTESSVANDLYELEDIFSNAGRFYTQGREKTRDLYNRGIDKFLDIKPIDILKKLNLDDISARHARRIIKATLTEMEIGLPVNTLNESHSRELDKLNSPQDKQLAYEMATNGAGDERLTAKHFEQAVERVTALRLAKLAAVNDETNDQPSPVKEAVVNKRYSAISLFESIAKTSTSKDADVFKVVLQSNKDVHAVLRLLMSDKLPEEEKKSLCAMLDHWN
jgi:hypothetical protein